MAITVTAEDGTGLADANAYASIADADAYFETRPRSDAWTALDADAKAVLLIHATRVLDAAMSWSGEPLSETQALAFPRVDGDGSSTGVPAALKTALFEMALALNAEDTTAQPATSGFSTLEVGPIKIVADQQRTQPTIPRFVADMVSRWGTPRAALGSVKLTRR